MFAKVKQSITIFSAVFLLAAGAFLPAFCDPVAASAAEEVYSDVLDDLRLDEEFRAEDYPERENDFSLSVIQVAESEDGELFVYVYRPSAPFRDDLTATTVRISTGINDNAKWLDYDLRLLSTQSVFDKYLVEDFTVKEDRLRYYDIPAIHRKWVAGVDDPPKEGSGNTIDEVVFEVAKLFTASTVADEVTYTCLATEVVTILNPYVGRLRYQDGFLLTNDACDSWYIAFDTDYAIDKLFEADVEYTAQDYEYSFYTTGNPLVPGDERWTYGEKETVVVTLDYTQRGEYAPGGWWLGWQYSWNRIESVADFIQNEDLTEDAISRLEGTKWVLRFAETSYWSYWYANGGNETGTEITEVTILRLKFETEGKVYNLGAVCKKITGGLYQDNEWWDLPNEMQTWWKVVIALLMLILLIVILWPILPYIVKAVVWVVLLPFRLIKMIVDACKKPKSNAEAPPDAEKLKEEKKKQKKPRKR